MAKFCRNCGKEIPPGIAFCTECGTKVPEEIKPEPTPAAEPSPAPTAVPSPAPKPAPAAAPAQTADEIPPKGSKYEPISTGGYVGILLLMCLPVIGLILAIIWACGGCTKINKRNLSRAYLIFMAISLVISIIIGVIFGAAAAAAISAAGNVFIDTPAITEYGTESRSNSEEGGLSGILDAFSGLTGGETNPDMEALNELEQILNGLEEITGEENGFDDLIDGAQKANEEAEATNDGWPKELPAYPYGTANPVASYRTEISGTNLEEMFSYINSLKSSGYVYKDFYDFGMSEDDMLGINSWWGTNGKVYVSLSYYEGIVTIDHTYELPNLEDYFG